MGRIVRNVKVGPSPECFAAIQAGNFEKAKQICSVSQTIPMNQTPTEQYQQYQQPYQQACSMIFPTPCPAGQHREQQIMNGCPVFGTCVPDQGTMIQPPMQQQQPCVPVPACPAGQYHPTEFNGCLKTECVASQWQQPSFPINQSACTGSQIRCYSSGSPDGWCQMPPCPIATPPTPCPSGNYWNGSACVPSTPPACPSGNYWNGNACVPSTTTNTTANNTTSKPSCKNFFTFKIPKRKGF